MASDPQGFGAFFLEGDMTRVIRGVLTVLLIMVMAINNVEYPRNHAYLDGRRVSRETLRLTPAFEAFADRRARCGDGQ
jgi:hypothetical protein